MSSVTYHTELIAIDSDCSGYTTLVFKNLEYDNLDFKYLMCVRYPNWNHGPVDIGDIGYLHVKYVEEGVDKWFDGVKLIPYKYTNCIFIKFVKETVKTEIKEILLD